MSDRPIRVVHVDANAASGFADLSTVREIFEDAIPRLEFLGIECASEDIPDRVGEADILLTASTPIPVQIMDAVEPSVIAKFATGVDDIDVEAATERGIPVTNVPTYCNQEVGEHAVALALALLRGLPHYDSAVRSGAFSWRTALPVRTATETTFGCFAFGKKAQAAARKAQAIGFDVIAHDAYMPDEEIEAENVDAVTFDRLVETSDVLSIHAPLTPETEALFDESVLFDMKTDAILINTARGAIIDETALVEALEEGPLYGAGLDVLRDEPPSEDNPLLYREDVIVTPHAAWYSEGAQERLQIRGSEIAVAAWRGERVDGIINPEALS